jgi:sugar lactone lactonase YvrE
MTAPTIATPTCVLDARASLGECPIWSRGEQVLYWIDINAPALHRFDPRSVENAVMPMPESIGCFALRAQGGFVLALRSGIWLADAHGRPTRKVVDAPYDPHHHRFNDGRCDPQGRLIVGTMNEHRDRGSGALYRLDPDFSLHELFGDMTISNGLGFSPDGRTMYHADTPTHVVRAYDYDAATGTPSRARVFMQWSGERERPDGATVDSVGNYWVALYSAGKVVQLSPLGRLVAEHPLPAMCPTMCAFGGEDLCTLYITTARQKREAGELALLPQSGGIFAMRVEVPGRLEPRFAG